jgi:hypothetical protein
VGHSNAARAFKKAAVGVLVPVDISSHHRA